MLGQYPAHSEGAAHIGRARGFRQGHLRGRGTGRTSALESKGMSSALASGRASSSDWL